MVEGEREKAAELSTQLERKTEEIQELRSSNQTLTNTDLQKLKRDESLYTDLDFSQRQVESLKVQLHTRQKDFNDILTTKEALLEEKNQRQLVAVHSPDTFLILVSF